MVVLSYEHISMKLIFGNPIGIKKFKLRRKAVVMWKQ